MSNSESHTLNSDSGYTSVVIDGVLHDGVFYLFYDRFKSVTLRKNGTELVGKEGELLHAGTSYRFRNTGTAGIWRVIGVFS